MKVLITELDLFAKVGGGQTVYRGLIEKNPQIDFYYLTTGQVADTPRRPPNAHSIRYTEMYAPSILSDYHDVTPPRWMYDPFVRASNIAASVSGQRFDVVEVADYEQFGVMLRPALAHHGVTFDRVVLALHGRISKSIALNWTTEGQSNRALEALEEMQYLTVDARYGISRTYLDEWRRCAGIEGLYASPLRFMDAPNPRVANGSPNPVSLNFVGRTEKRKGPDIFLELAWWLPREKYSTANVIGPESYGPNGTGSGLHLYTMAQNRSKDVRFVAGMTGVELENLFSSRAITMLPSRYDSFNLVALESLFSGCPTAVGSGAGVVRFLTEELPEVPFVLIDMADVYGCLPQIVSVLEDYERHRERIVTAFRRFEPEIDGSSCNIYESPRVWDPDVRDQLDKSYQQLTSFYAKAERNLVRRARAGAVEFVRAATTPDVRQAVRRFRSQIRPSHLRTALRERLRTSAWRKDAWVGEQVFKARQLRERYRYLFYLPEQSDSDLRRKMHVSWDIASDIKIDRVRIWREIARLGRLRGNELLAATYELRVMRALGEDRFGDLSLAVRSLERAGFNSEARTAEAMFGPVASRTTACADLLEQARRNNATQSPREYEFVDDRRGAMTPRVSVIVSLYDAAKKVRAFLRCLSNQTLIRAHVAEVILIDSGSPGSDYGSFKSVMETLDVAVVYARSPQRETIQSAWNRGIALARAPYLAFLGVDEALLPDCLKILSAELDSDPGLDWVQGNSLVTAVDPQGLWLRDIMPYDRTGYRQDLAYLETCYLSWVGALYRRSIHDRFGYYDSTFGAAGDTEFKNRVLPFIRSKSIPLTLGLFWNFPEDRATLSPRAEIEDLRAWYLHRTIAGVRYAFANRDPHDIETLVCDALRYRKSYTMHPSTDIEYAHNLLTILAEYAPDSPLRRCADGVVRVLRAYQALDYLRSAKSAMLAPVRAYDLVTRIDKAHRDLRLAGLEPAYHIFNDNRYEQHSNVWRSDD